MKIEDYLYQSITPKEVINISKNGLEEKKSSFKYSLPTWLRKLVFGGLNPFYVYYIFKSINKPFALIGYRELLTVSFTAFQT